MNLFKRRMQLFCISNIMVSFVCTGFLGTNYCATSLESGQNDNQEVVVADEVIPLSQEESKKESVTTETKKSSTKKTTKKTVSKVTQKEVKSSASYAPAKYNEVTGKSIVDYAKRYIGLRYVSGGYSLTSGTDCSGFTKLIYKEFGITLSRIVSGQMKSGTYVRKSDLQKGDLVFYSNGGSKPTHVAIYIGDGKVIHESNHRDGVKYSSVNMMHYVTARRVINSTANKIAEEKANASNASSTTNNTTNTTTSTSSQTTNNAVTESNQSEEVVEQDTTQTESTVSNVDNNMDNKQESTNETESTN